MKCMRTLEGKYVLGLVAQRCKGMPYTTSFKDPNNQLGINYSYPISLKHNSLKI